MACFCLGEPLSSEISSILNSYRLRTAPGVELLFRDSGTEAPPLLLLHSLSDNAYAFDAVLASGLQSRFRAIIPDLRGRGDSSRPEAGYALDDHCADLIALLDHLGLQQVYVAGHSFGGYLGLYFAARFPQRVKGLTLIDTADELHTLTPLFLILITDRLGRWYPSVDAYILSVRAAPFITYWDDDMRRAFLSDTQLMPDGTLYVKTQKHHIVQCAADIYRMEKKDWRAFAQRFAGPALVLCAAEPFLMGQHVVPEQNARETSVLFPKGVHEVVSGNHMTMLFGAGAREIATAIIRRFL